MFFISSAYAQGTAPAAASDTSALIMQFLPFVLIFVVFYLLLIRPQQRKAREHRAKLEAIRRGDRVLLGGGIIGKVTKSGTDELEVEIADDVRVSVIRGTIAEVFNKTEPTAPKGGDPKKTDTSGRDEK
ncbi:MAG: preprotein translocase subunit YajC [Alphaproteobacteria bacterium]